MARLDHDRCCDEVVGQTTLLRDVLAGADLSLVVPTTPDWTLGDLARHIGGNLLAGEQAVRTGTAVTEPERQVPGHGGPVGDDPAALDAWLAGAADRFAGTLRKAGPATEAQIWTIRWPTAAWARRAAHDLVVHRADAAGALDAAYPLDPEVAADAVDEFLDLLSNPQVAGTDAAGAPGLRGTVHLHATNTVPELASEWLVELEPPPSPGASPTRRRPWPSAPPSPTSSGSSLAACHPTTTPSRSSATGPSSMPGWTASSSADPPAGQPRRPRVRSRWRRSRLVGRPMPGALRRDGATRTPLSVK